MAVAEEAGRSAAAIIKDRLGAEVIPWTSTSALFDLKFGFYMKFPP